MSDMTREMLDYPAVNPQTCILAVDNPESGYCIVPSSAMRRYAESHDALVKALQQIVDGSQNKEIGNAEFRVKAAQSAQGALGPVGEVTK